MASPLMNPLAQGPSVQPPMPPPAPLAVASAGPPPPPSESSRKRVSYVVDWRNRIKAERSTRERVWRECWELYRCAENQSNKEDWQSKLVFPKAFNSVKQATSVVMRLLALSQKPWTIEPVNDEDIGQAARASQWEALTRQFLDMAAYRAELKIGLECGFILGVAVWKLWWGIGPRDYRTVAAGASPTNGGRLFIRAVNPMNFYWLPGSTANNLVGTIEDIEVPKYELLEMAKQGIFDEASVRALSPMRIGDERNLAHGIDESASRRLGPNSEADVVKITEFFGPLVLADGTYEPHAHIIIANDDVELLPGARPDALQNPFLHTKPPYVMWTPLIIPFRTDGVGLIEHVRGIDKAFNQLGNLGMDTMLYRLLPVFEVIPEAFENQEDFRTGLTPGKIFRKTQQYAGAEGIRPVPFQDISQGAVQMAAILDRAHQEGSLISEIQQALPRYRGIMTATETDAKQQNQDSFFGGLATDIEEEALQPIVEMGMDLIAQYLDTAQDPRVAAILGVDARYLMAMSQSEILAMVAGDYIVKVTGISEQIEKMETLQNLVQLMNIIGQNPMVWAPYLRHDKLLERVLSCFRPAIPEVEDLIETPEIAQAKMAAMQQHDLAPDAMSTMVQMRQMDLSANQQQHSQMMDEARLALEAARLEEDARANRAAERSIPSK